MTPEQKVGQMLMIGIVGQEATPELCDSLAQVHPGGVILKRENASNPRQTRRFLGDLQECIEAATGVPLFISVDHEGEYLNRFNEGSTTFPAALAQGATGDPRWRGLWPRRPGRS
jgi:beta-N-acetylhexosaminidase